MLKGLNEKLEQTLYDYSEGAEGTDWAKVMTDITNSVAVGDEWYLPVDAIPEGMNETDYADGRVLERLPAFFKRTITVGDKEMYCAFTSSEKVCAGDCSKPVMTLAYPAEQLLREIAAGEGSDGFILNPWSDSFGLGREEIEKVLELAGEVPEEQICSMQSYRLEPKAVIDTDRILEEWKQGWEENAPEEKWMLRSFPIMADGRVLLLFEMKDSICEGGYDSFHVEHTFSHFRVLEYRLEDGGLKQIGKYRFSAQDAYVQTAFLHDGKLNAAICPRSGETFSILPMIPKNDEGQFEIFRYVRAAITNGKGELIAAYDRNQLDESRLPLLVFDGEGEIAVRYHDEHALSCTAIDLDREENIWFHLYPSQTVDMLDPANKKVESHRVALQGFDTMAFSDDRSKLFVSFEEYRCTAVFYVMTRDGNGDYVKPIRFEFLPETAEGEEKQTAGYRDFGGASAMKNWVLLRSDGKLYLYDINDC